MVTGRDTYIRKILIIIQLNYIVNSNLQFRHFVIVNDPLIGNTVLRKYPK